MARLYLVGLKVARQSKQDLLSLFAAPEKAWSGKKNPKITRSAGAIKPVSAALMSAAVFVGPVSPALKKAVAELGNKTDAAEVTELAFTSKGSAIYAEVHSPLIDKFESELNIKENGAHILLAHVEDESITHELVQKVNQLLKKKPLVIKIGKPYIESGEAVNKTIADLEIPVIKENAPAKGAKNKPIFLATVTALINSLVFLNLFYIDPSKALIRKAQSYVPATGSFFINFPSVVGIYKDTFASAMKGDEKFEKDLEQLGKKIQSLKSELLKKRLELVDEDEEIPAKSYWDLLEMLAFSLANPEHAHMIWYNIGNQMNAVNPKAFSHALQAWKAHS